MESMPEAYASFIAEVLLFGMSRTFVKFDAKASDGTSPLIDDIILTTLLPKPIKTFVGREKESEELHELLEEHQTLFMQGVAGIGKSELIKQYIKLHRKEYTNILFLDYSGSLYEMVADLDFVDDTDGLTEKEQSSSFHET